MIRILGEVVADWRPFIFRHNGHMIEQVQVCLFNGMLLIMNVEDFFFLADDESRS